MYRQRKQEQFRDDVECSYYLPTKVLLIVSDIQLKHVG